MTIRPDQPQREADTTRWATARFGVCRLSPAVDDRQDWPARNRRAGRTGRESQPLPAPFITNRVGAILLPAFPRRRLAFPLPVVSRRKFVRAVSPQAGGRGAFHRSPAFRGHHFTRSYQVSRQASPDLLPVVHLSFSTRVIPAAPRSSGKGTQKIGKAVQQGAA